MNIQHIINTSVPHFFLPILLLRDIWPVSMAWLLQIQSHSWDCGHIPEKLIAFPLAVCQKWV